MFYMADTATHRTRTLTDLARQGHRLILASFSIAAVKRSLRIRLEVNRLMN